jgi:hypothetical protein
MLLALKTSPDHHEAQIEALIASKDPEAMYNYVKNSIVLTPSSTRLNKEGSNIRYNKKGIYRTGMASARGKAELLKDMLNQAGFEAQVVWEKTDFDEDSILKCYFRDYDNHFSPNISEEQIESWEDALGVKETSVDLYEDIDTRAEKLAEKILSHIDIEDRYLDKTKIEWSNSSTPTVKFKLKEKELFAHLVDPDVPFGELRNKNASVSTYISAPQLYNPKVELSLEARHSRDITKPIKLLNGDWKVQDLIGKQINISFLKDVKLGELSSKTFNQLQFFTPTFSLESIDDEYEFLEQNSYLGEPMAIDGERIILDENDPENLASKLAYDKPIDLQKIDTIECKAKPLVYPRVRLEVNVKDVNGNRIEGLQVKNFEVKEDGKNISAFLKNNRQQPKVLMLFDTSLSMPSEYRNEGIKKFEQKLESIITANYPYASVETWQVGSNLYESLLKASQESVDLILYCTDGHVHDKLNPNDIPLYKRGAPALILDVMENESPVFKDLADLTSGLVVPARDQEKTTKAIYDYLDKLDPPSYIFEYNSRNKGKHVAEVKIVESEKSDTDAYTFPEKNDNETGLVSLLLNIKIGSKLYRKTLAGASFEDIQVLQYSFDDFKYTKRELRNQVRGFLFGGAQLYIEADGPTTAMAISDVLKAQLTNRAWGEALLNDDIDLAKEAYEKGTRNVSGSLLSLLTRPKNVVTQSSLTYVSGYRLALYKTSMPVEDENGSVSFDYFQSSDYKTLGKDPISNFKRTAAITAQLALREFEFFENNTYRSLSSSKLISDQEFKTSKDKDFVSQTREVIYNKNMRKKLIDNVGNYVVFDRNLNSWAYWKINTNSGELYGMLPNGTGGGGDDLPYDNTLDDTLSLLLNLVAIMEHIVKIATAGRVAMLANPAAGVSLAIVAKYGVTLAKIYGIVTQTIIVMDASGLNEKVKKELQILACQVYKEIVFGMFGDAGTAYSGLESIIGMLSPQTESPFKCK